MRVLGTATIMRTMRDSLPFGESVYTAELTRRVFKSQDCPVSLKHPLRCSQHAVEEPLVGTAAVRREGSTARLVAVGLAAGLPGVTSAAAPATLGAAVVEPQRKEFEDRHLWALQHTESPGVTRHSDVTQTSRC